jgi:hypothetical protein
MRIEALDLNWNGRMGCGLHIGMEPHVRSHARRSHLRPYVRSTMISRLVPARDHPHSPRGGQDYYVAARTLQVRTCARQRMEGNDRVGQLRALACVFLCPKQHLENHLVEAGKMMASISCL